MKSNRHHAWILPVIVIAQFAGTSLWFVGNAVLPELKQSLQLSTYAVSLVTSSVMIGFVAGTLSLSIFSVADRFAPSKVFLLNACLGALFNLLVAWLANSAFTLALLRFATGFCIAGIYPIGMKIAADWYDKKLGKAMGFLLGALIVGTAFPHLLRAFNWGYSWKMVLYLTSAFALTGGILMYFFVGEGPYRKASGKFQWSAIPTILASRRWRQAAYGYFGHMWELYAFWGFTPLILGLYAKLNHVALNIPLFSFLIIAIGSISSMIGGMAAQKFGSDKVATVALFISGTCALLSPIFYSLPTGLFLAFMFLWGFTVSPDSPQFSTLVAFYAPPQLRGTALAFYNAIGFTITIISLMVTDRLFHAGDDSYSRFALMQLALGAAFGLPPMLKIIRGK